MSESGRLVRVVGRLALLLGGAIVALVLVIVGLRLYESWAGLDVTEQYLAEPRPGMWQEDALLGYANKPNLDRRVVGNVAGRTNGAGFRADVEFAPGKVEGGYRVVGLGDSVMWGTRVNQEDSLLGVLETLLQPIHPNLEVINAGVIGYSTYQERLFLEERILSYRPDLVLVNFCENDWLATEDPFGNVRSIYLAFMDRLLREGKRFRLSQEERSTVVQLRKLFLTAPKVWPALGDARLSPSVLRKLLLEIPILEMASIAKQNDIRLIYLFVPESDPTPQQRRVEVALQGFLRGLDVEFIDLLEDLGADHPSLRSDPSNALPLERLVAWYQDTMFGETLARWSLSALDPVPTLKRIGSYRASRRRHAESNFIDAVHPSEKGNRIIAERIFDYLEPGPPR